MFHLTQFDALAGLLFIVTWFGYSWLVDRSNRGGQGLTARMAGFRRAWMNEMRARSNRIIDGQINMTLQQGTAFFASTALLAVGACLTLLGASDKAIEILSTLQPGEQPSRAVWELKVAGLTLIFVYAFFKFAWAYRLFNYCAILIGATPDREHADTEAGIAAANRAAAMNSIAARHFNRGQRAFFFALGYLGWFAGPIAFIVATAAVVVVLYRRQFASDSLDALA
ncbi:MAG: DUF599 family protein [Alphaproteobacteria bacterium]|jgi:uncharacterized membrane protein